MMLGARACRAAGLTVVVGMLRRHVGHGCEHVQQPITVLTAMLTLVGCSSKATGPQPPTTAHQDFGAGHNGTRPLGSTGQDKPFSYPSLVQR
jgi:hypothetical protein